MKLLLLCLCYTFQVVGQQFPSNFAGSYSGTMIINSGNGVSDSLSVEFEFLEQIPDSSWTYKMIFKSPKYGEITKDYLLKSKTKKDTSNYIFDEQNGILMEMTFLNNCLYGMYEVEGQYFISTLRIIDEEQLLYDLIIAPATNPSISTYTGEEKFEVKSYKPTMQQTVYLKKVH